MTRIAMISSIPRLPSEDWNCSAAPANMVVMVEGSVLSASVLTSASALPSDAPGARLKEMVTEGICPLWLTDSGPIVVAILTKASSGTILPSAERTYSSDRVEGSAWYLGSSSSSTQYSSSAA